MRLSPVVALTAAIVTPISAAALAASRTVTRFTVTDSSYCVKGNITTISVREKDLTNGQSDELDKCHAFDRSDIKTAYLTTELRAGCTLYWYRDFECSVLAHCPIYGECMEDAIGWGSWRATCSPSYQPQCSRIG